MEVKIESEIESLVNRVKAREVSALARLLTCLEQEGPVCLQHPELISPPSTAFRVGITGPPGSGKSTLTGQIIKDLRARGLSLAILAVDPSSPFSKGAILGDRIRYTEFASDPEVYIRSVGTRGSLGGLSSAIYLMLRALDLFGFDMVLIETVGVGQTELEVIHVADFIAVVLVPESGDSIQIMKAGLMEIADGYVVNKSDRPGAIQMLREIQAQHPRGSKSQVTNSPATFATVATQGSGIKEVVDHLIHFKSQVSFKSQRIEPLRLQWEARSLLRGVYENQISQKVNQIQTPSDFADLWQSPS